MGSSNATLASDYWGQSKASLIFPTACTASNLAVNLGYESLTFPFLLETDLTVNGTTALPCSAGYDTGYSFTCTSSGTDAIPADTAVALQFSHTGQTPQTSFHR